MCHNDNVTIMRQLSLDRASKNMSSDRLKKRIDSRFFPVIFDAISHGIFTIDSEGLITGFNRKAEQLTGYRSDDVIGEPCCDIFRADICQTDCTLKHSIKTGQAVEDREVTILTKAGRQVPIAISTAALVGPDGTVLGGVEMFRDLSTVTELRKRLFDSYVLEDIVSKSQVMQNIFDMLPLVANSRSNVLIEGESGTGKELVARAIHNLGPRRKKPFVAVNCGALPEALLESELFGYRKGAFTDARSDKPGRFARAEGGSMMLDEIGDMNQGTQVKLLRVLQEKEYEPLGATTSIKSDVRIIAATNTDLALEVQRKKFRQDLFFRLNVVRLTIPPLRERKDDIHLLVSHFIEKHATAQTKASSVSTEALAVLQQYDWPGNVRQLENTIQRVLVLCDSDIVLPRHLPAFLLAEAAPDASLKEPDGLVEKAEKNTIADAMERTGGNKAQAARLLGISRVTLYAKLKKYGLEE